MSVMEQMRSGSDSTFMQVVMALVVVSFVFWYAAPMGDKSSIVAEVNGTRIMDTDFRRLYREMERMRESQFGRALSEPEKKQLTEDVKQQLIENEVLLQEAWDIGLEVSDTEVAKQLLSFNAFRNEDGAFDNDLYERYLKRAGYTKADFEERLREDLLRAKLRQLVFMGATISEPVLREAYIERNTKVNVTYVRIRPTAFYDAVEITDEDLAAWMAENADKVKEIYERDYDRLYNHAAEVKLRMIRLQILQDGEGAAELLPRLRALKEEIEAGADFAEMAKKWSEDPSAASGGDLGMRSVKQLASDIRDGVDHLEVGQISKVVTTNQDLRIFLLEEKKDSYVDSFDETKEQIARQTIQQERAPEIAQGFARDTLLPRWKEKGEPPKPMLAKKGLTSIPTGLVPARSDGSPFKPPKEMMDATRSAAAGDVLPEVYESNGMYWVGQLTAREDADMDQFEIERDTIREEVLVQRRSEFYEAWVADAKARASIKI